MVTILVIAIIIGAVLGYRYFKKKQEENLFTKRKINPLITVGTVGSLKKMPEPLVNTNHNSSKSKEKDLSNNNNRSSDNGLNNNNNSNKSSGDISSNTDNKSKDDIQKVPPPEMLVTIDGELQDVDADKEIKEQKRPEKDETNGDKVEKDKADKVDKTEHKEEKSISNGTVTVFDLTENEANVLKTNQPNGVISKEDMENKPDKEMGEKVNSESVKPEKRVTFPDQPPEGLGKREKTILPSDEAKRAPNEEVSNFGKDKTGMNSRMPSRGGVKPTESSGSLDVLFGKNGVLKPEPQDPHSTLGPRDTTLTDIII
ncbi:intermembrane lipid transfer protein vps13F-like [Saccostrea cucullata]|uniref:intermembrane lipid transfer protein vps13F-like n=1 Tax=Saccostrea cuccullata TaxID=36930 RepID=UPI002ED69091